MASVADVLLKSGQDIAAGKRAQGEISANLYSNLANIVGSLPRQYQQAVQQDQATKLGALQVAAAQREQKSVNAFESALKDPANYNPDGTSKDDQIASVLKKNDVGAWEHWQAISTATQKARLEAAKTATDIQATQTSTEEKQQAAQQLKAEYLGNLAYHGSKLIDQAPNDLLHVRDTTLATVARAAADGAISGDEAKSFIAQTAGASPDQMKQVFESFITPKVRATNDAAAIETELKKSEIVKNTRPEAITGPELDARYQQLFQKKQSGGLSKSEQDEMDAYDARKTVTTDATATAAAKRLADTQEHANQLQERAQNFHVAETARGDLKKTEDAYTGSLAASNELRNLVSAARHGNKEAASLQNFQAAAALIRQNGLNRINTVEIGLPASAGSMFDQIEGKISKLTSGQPVPDDLQKDMLEFADILDKSAYKKYSDGFDTTAKYYGLNDQQKSLKLKPDTTSATPASVGRFNPATGKIEFTDGR